MIHLFYILGLVFILSCGKAVDNENETQNQEEVNLDGTYMALLVPVNGKISSNINGEAKIFKFGDEFKVDVRVKGSPKGTFVHSLHTGSRCPKLESDRNHDGYLDALESKDSIGAIIVPFDGNLSSQREGEDFVSTGNFHYIKSTSYYLMLSDLHLIDDVVNDEVVKLREKELPLERKVVVVYMKNRSFPISIAGNKIPVACGVLTRISDEETSGDSWEEQQSDERRPIPRPRPRPRPTPDPQPEIDTDPQPDSWWQRWRQRWNRWRNRWGGSNGNEGSGSER